MGDNSSERNMMNDQEQNANTWMTNQKQWGQNGYLKNDDKYDLAKPLFILIVTIMYFVIVGYLLQLSWNYVIPEVFKCGKLDYKQAVVIVIMARILTTGGHMCYSYKHVNRNITAKVNGEKIANVQI